MNLENIRKRRELENCKYFAWREVSNDFWEQAKKELFSNKKISLIPALIQEMLFHNSIKDRQLELFEDYWKKIVGAKNE